MSSPYATISENRAFNAGEFADQLEKALRSNGGNKNAVAEILTSINNQQRQQLLEPYRLRHNADLMKTLEKAFSGDLGKLINALMITPLEYDVKQLKQAVKGIGTDETVLIEILCSRTAEQLRAIRIEYEHVYGVTLDKDVADDTSGEFKDLLVALISGSKDTSHDTNDAQAKDDAVRLFADGKAKLAGKGGPNYFFKILATQNQYQLRKVFAQYEEMAGAPIEKAIEKEFSGDLQRSYLALVRAASDKQNFFAIQLYNSMKGLGTRENDLTRALVSRSEIDLAMIKDKFQQLYKKPLEDMVKGDTSGGYRDALLAVIRGNRF